MRNDAVQLTTNIHSLALPGNGMNRLHLLAHLEWHTVLSRLQLTCLMPLLDGTHCTFDAMRSLVSLEFQIHALLAVPFAFDAGTILGISADGNVHGFLCL